MRWKRPEAIRGVKKRKVDLRESAIARGYDKYWARESRRRRRLHGICECCEMLGIVKPICGKFAGIVDHVLPLCGLDDPLRLQDWNLWVLCQNCHGLKTAHVDPHVRLMPRTQESAEHAKQLLVDTVRLHRR